MTVVAATGASQRTRAVWPDHQRSRPRPATEPTSYLRTAQVADLLQVSPKTISRWAKEGKLPFFKTLGSYRRYPEAKIRELVATLREEPTG